jgi:dimeric dUTPase (all-alpha-NTP-PPase superfamily)
MFNATKTDLVELLKKQEELNVKYSGENWRDVSNLTHWYVALFTEVSEFLESAPRVGVVGSDGWKFWRKNLENDIQNMKVETIDVLHFGLSIVLYKAGSLDSAISLATEEIFVADYEEFKVYTESEEFSDFEALDSLMNSVCELYSVSIKGDCLQEVLDIVSTMEAITCMADNCEPFVLNGYIKKNQLNHKRVESGYQTGEYDKMSSGEEDNKKLEL